MPKASPHVVPHITQPSATWSPVASSVTPTDGGEHIDPLATIVHSVLGAHGTRSTRHKDTTKGKASRSLGDLSDHGTGIVRTTGSLLQVPNSAQTDAQSPKPPPHPSRTPSALRSTNLPTTATISENTAELSSEGILYPHALSSEGGVVGWDHTVRPGHELTLGNGAHTTVVSVRKDKGTTVVVYDGTTTLAMSDASTAHSKDVTSNTHGLVSLNSRSQYVVDGQTLTPSSPITLTGNEGPVTFRMLMSSSSTFIAIGSTTTIPLIDDTSSAMPLAFTKASNGEFVLHGTTLASGKPITIGRGSDQTTLRMTTMGGIPAVVVDGATTKLLGHSSMAGSAGSSFTGSLPPIITNASTPLLGLTSTSVQSVTISTRRSSASRNVSWLPGWAALLLPLLCLLPQVH